MVLRTWSRRFGLWSILQLVLTRLLVRNSCHCGEIASDGGGGAMSEPNEFVTQQEKETGRIEAFSDGVFAIAITLLILEIKVPNAHDLGAGGLGAALIRLWPSYLAFVTSFAT